MTVRRMKVLLLSLLAADDVSAYGKRPGERQLELLKREPDPPAGEHTTSVAVFAAGWCAAQCQIARHSPPVCSTFAA
jgi:hypothetical protein